MGFRPAPDRVAAAGPPSLPVVLVPARVPLAGPDRPGRYGRATEAALGWPRRPGRALRGARVTFGRPTRLPSRPSGLAERELRHRLRYPAGRTGGGRAGLPQLRSTRGVRSGRGPQDALSDKPTCGSSPRSEG